MTPGDPTGPLSYEVVVSGLLGPALLASFQVRHVARTTATTVFRLRVPSHAGPSHIAELMSARGLVVVSAREVPER